MRTVLVLLVLAVLAGGIVVLMIRERFALLHAELDEAYAPKPLDYSAHLYTKPGETVLHLYVPSRGGAVKVGTVVLTQFSRDFTDGASAEFADYARWIQRRTYSGPFGAP